MRRHRRVFQALMLAAMLVLFGHDAVMATNPHGQSIQHLEEASEHESDESDCHLQAGALTTVNSDSWQQPGHSVLHLMPVADDAPSQARVSWMAPPGHPPDLIRALLQVFLN